MSIDFAIRITIFGVIGVLALALLGFVLALS